MQYINILKLTVLVFFFQSLISCTYLQKLRNQIKSSKIEGPGAETISSVDMDSNFQGGSDTENIEGLKTIYFDLDSSQLSEATKTTLRGNKEWLENNPKVKKILLEGHCDSLGSEAYNLGLGERRAKSVFNYLNSIGLEKNKMDIISYGEENPISQTNNELNRRVNFVPQY